MRPWLALPNGGHRADGMAFARKAACKGLAATAFVALLSGCGIIRVDGADIGPTLADLSAPILPVVRTPLNSASVASIEAGYRSALEVTNDPELRQQILVRLADVQMQKSEREQFDEGDKALASSNFDAAITEYNQLLDSKKSSETDRSSDERLLYRLAKAYAMDSRLDESNQALAQLVERYPNSPYLGEAQFRMAEHAFSSGDYKRAQELYKKVIDGGEDAGFHTNALYMYGWSQFKDNQFRSSVEPFTLVLDKLIPADGNLESLPESSRGLVNDTLRVMGINFSYLDGAESIKEVYETLGPRHYQHLIYQQLGKFYLQKERYTDSAKTFDTYASTFPSTVRAPDFALQRLEVLKRGGLTEDVLASKEAFVAKFGVASEYWAGLTEPERDQRVRPTLLLFLDELSSFYHAKAQALLAAEDTAQQAAKTRKKRRKAVESASANFLTAADYYQQFIATFPSDKSLGEKTFLMAEALNDAGKFEAAVTAFERVGFELQDTEFGAKAGYNMIVTLQKLVDASEGEQQNLWRDQKIAAALSFAEVYPENTDAPAILIEAANNLFKQNKFEQALPIAQRVSQWQPTPNLEVQKTAWLIVAHIKFDAKLYAEAETAYREVLNRVDQYDPERSNVAERIAASMFQKAEQQAAAGNLPEAIEQLLAIEQVSPNSEIAIKAKYDAGNYLMEQENWGEAEILFSQIKSGFNQHPLTATLAPKFAVIYQELQLWDKAASALTDVARNTQDPEQKRQAMYLAAELYQKSGQDTAAIKAYTNYLNAYPKPFDLATEARYQLLQIATERRNLADRNYWQQQMIAADKKAGKNTTQRARFLAASAANEFALAEFNDFEKIKLILPIKKSLNKKKKALERTLDAYKEVIQYEVGDYVTEANYRIGNVYSQLSRDLMDSERPKGLDELTLEQYEILLEEQAYPFEEKSIELLATNAERAWDGFYDDWVKRSLEELAKLMPARYGKQESSMEVSSDLD